MQTFNQCYGIYKSIQSNPIPRPSLNPTQETKPKSKRNKISRDAFMLAKLVIC